MPSEYYVVTLRVCRKEDDDHPGRWDWQELIGGDVALISVEPSQPESEPANGL